jgi:dihydroorotase-like cyclic amidohydrolase
MSAHDAPGAGEDPVAPYEALAALAERELLLVSAGEPEQLDELAVLASERAAIVASLPARPPAAAEPALARAATTQARTTSALAVRAAEVRRSLSEVERGRRTARGYGLGAPERVSVDQAC